MRQLQSEELLHALDLIARQKAAAEMNHPLDQLEGQAARLLRELMQLVVEHDELERQALVTVNTLLQHNALLRATLEGRPPETMLN